MLLREASSTPLRNYGGGPTQSQYLQPPCFTAHPHRSPEHPVGAGLLDRACFDGRDPHVSRTCPPHPLQPAEELGPLKLAAAWPLPRPTGALGPPPPLARLTQSPPHPPPACFWQSMSPPSGCPFLGVSPRQPPGHPGRTARVPALLGTLLSRLLVPGLQRMPVPLFEQNSSIQ